jgi:hypothetical protein
MSRDDHRLHDEIVALRRQLEQFREPQSDVRFTPKEVIGAATGTLIAFAGMLSENETVVYSFLSIPCVTYLYLCLKQKGPLFLRSIAAILVLLAFAAITLLVHQRGLKREQDDVESKLTIQPFMPTSRNVLRTGVMVTNGGGIDIGDHRIGCVLRRVTYSPHGGMQNLSMSTILPGKFGLRAYGDSETSYCIAGIQSFPPDSHAVCMDITVVVLYSLATQPKVQKRRPLRFVADGEDFIFRPQPVDYTGDYCPQLN